MKGLQEVKEPPQNYKISYDLQRYKLIEKDPFGFELDK